MDEQRSPAAVLDAIPAEPGAHLELCVIGAAAHLHDRIASVDRSLVDPGGRAAMLTGYVDTLQRYGAFCASQWDDWVSAWAAARTDRLPLARLQDAAGLDALAVRMLVTVGLVHEDDRFAGISRRSSVPAGSHRPPRSSPAGGLPRTSASRRGTGWWSCAPSG